MLSPKDIYPPEWLDNTQQKTESIPVLKTRLHHYPEYSSRRLSSGCLLIQLQKSNVPMRSGPKTTEAIKEGAWPSNGVHPIDR